MIQLRYKRELRGTRGQVRRAKRLADLGVAAALIALTLPLMAIVALAIKCDSPGPVFYRQERCRLGGGRFIALKFRSTVCDSDLDHGAPGVVEQEACPSRVGRFLRYSRIDNLPQLFNVIRGEMSVIDAGPERPYFLD
jgi:lipopolysaccharide/colanic/teichoic acid biosynthesis glycosyltransferase